MLEPKRSKDVTKCIDKSLHVVEPSVRQGLLRRKSLLWVKICQPTDEIFEVAVVHSVTLPKLERPARLFLAKPSLDDHKDLIPVILCTDIAQEAIEAVSVCKIRYLMLEHNGQLVHPFRQVCLIY